MTETFIGAYVEALGAKKKKSKKTKSKSDYPTDSSLFANNFLSNDGMLPLGIFSSSVKNNTNPNFGEGTAGKAAQIALGEVNMRGQQAHKKYGEKGAWCAAFVDWAYQKASGLVKTPWGNSHSVVNIAEWAKNANKFVQTNDFRAGAKTGDLIVFKRSHIGMITKVDENGTVHTIEGNTGDKVAERTYNAGSDKIKGFIKMS